MLKKSKHFYFISGLFLLGSIHFAFAESPNSHSLKKSSFLTKNSEKPLLAGYLESYYGPWNQNITISDAAKQGYDLQIIAFAQGLTDEAPQADKSELPLMQFYGNLFLAYTKYNTMTKAYAQQISDDIALAKNQYGLKHVLISVGGESGNIVLEGKNLKNIAENLRDFLNFYHLDGVDFDIENKVDPALLDQLITLIKSKPLANGETVLVSAAPQLNTTDTQCQPWDHNPSCAYKVSLVTTGNNQDYKIAVENGDFDFLFLQDYNTGSASNMIRYQNDDVDETMPNYIPASYYYLLGQTEAKQELIHIPKQTKILPGEPATQAAGGANTIYHNDKVTDKYAAMANAYQILLQESQFGGAMTWSINQDSDGGYQFANVVGHLFQ